MIHRNEIARLGKAAHDLATALPDVRWHPSELPADAESLSELGRALWREGCLRVQQGDHDDRYLYWQRLSQIGSLVRAGLEEAPLSLLEDHSRGLGDLRYPADGKRVLVTGFDPFHLDDQLNQGNPSGLVAQALHGQTLDSADGVAHVCSIVVPVRFADFDAGWIENLFSAALDVCHVDLIITISMGRTGFDLERFPGLRRSSGNPDNDNQVCGDSAAQPKVPANLKGPEFVEFTLPVKPMLAVGGPYSVTDNRRICTLERGEYEAGSLAELSKETAVRGSGGGYLSNEISYRLLNLMRNKGFSLPAGHIHTPRLAGFDGAVMTSILGQTRQLVAAAVKTL